jgi:hypothetical protein
MSETSRVRDWTQKGLTSKLTSGSVTGKRARALEGNDPETSIAVSFARESQRLHPQPRLIELKLSYRSGRRQHPYMKRISDAATTYMERESWVMKVTALNGQNLICLLV